jgi:predicted SAM-dependent methyltransferase
MKKLPKTIRFNIGSGKKNEDGFINIDRNRPADIIYDLNKFPWPIKDSSVSEVRMWHLLEHLDNPQQAMKEIWRICKPNAIVDIKIPWYKRKSILWNPEHKHDFMPEWFKSIDPSTTSHMLVYSCFANAPKEKFKIIENKVTWLTVRMLEKVPILIKPVRVDLEIRLRTIK